MKSIEQAKEDFSFFNEGDYITREMAESKDIILEYVKQLENELNNLEQLKHIKCPSCDNKAIVVDSTLNDRLKKSMKKIDNIVDSMSIEEIENRIKEDEDVKVLLDCSNCNLKECIRL